MGEVATQDKPQEAQVPARRIEAIDLSERTAPRMTFLPTNMQEAMQLANLMSSSNFVPGHLRGKPGDCLAVIMQSSLWGMNCYAVANKTYFVNDRMAYEAQLVNAVVNSSGALDGRLQVEWEGQGNDLVCTVEGRIKGDPQTKERRVPISGLTTRNSPLWKQDPEQQLAYYATRAWARLYTPEVLMGVYTPDEVREMGPTPDVDGGTVTTHKLSVADLREQAKPRVEAQADQSLDDDAQFLAGDGGGQDLPEASQEQREAEGVDTATDDNPAAVEGRSDEQHGDQHDGTDEAGDQAPTQDEPDASEDALLLMIKQCEEAQNDKQYRYVKTQFDKAQLGLSLEQIKRFEGPFNAMKARLKIT